MYRSKWDLIGAKKPRKKRTVDKNTVRNDLAEGTIQDQIIHYLHLQGWVVIRF